MIRVDAQPEPSDFDQRVRRPGQEFLRTRGYPSHQQFRNAKAEYWTRCLSQLRTAYSSICAYSSCWLATGYSLDHFVPKSVRSDLAYEWTNYRLASERINSYKASSTEVLDPFHIVSGWFILDMASFYVRANRDADEGVRTQVQKTIDILRLNAEDFVQQRFEMVRDYAAGDVSLDFLKRRYPFIAYELDRQGRSETIKVTFRER